MVRAVGFLLLFMTVFSNGEQHSEREVPSISPNAKMTCDGPQCSTWFSQCSWSPAGFPHLMYSLIELIDKQYETLLPTPRGAQVRLKLCGTLQCNDATSASCITVPGVKPTSAGKVPDIQPLEEGVASSGFQLTLDDGVLCEVTNKPRKTIIKLPCDPNKDISANDFLPLKAFEGNKKQICHYFVEFPASQYGCPLYNEKAGNTVTLEAVSGCLNSSPLKSTSNCHYNGGQTLSLIGTGLSHLCPLQQEQESNKRLHLTTEQLAMCTKHLQEHYRILVGHGSCTKPVLISPLLINCTLSAGNGENLDVKVMYECGADESRCSAEVVAMLAGAVSYRQVINFKDKFSRFVDHGVGGLKKEIEELYRRAFASRDVSPGIVAQLGITHVKGILLYGPPGAGKTLLARTVAHLLGSKQVQLINGPEIISKYLGESERNLRQYFQEATDAYKEHGDASELFVIIIDEIEAICKPRGKSDQSSAGAAYDSLVNQLLTLMDGLSEMNNILVIGLTNRKELMDPALLRPGRFEVQINVGLPDEEGREEIFAIHTRTMRESGSLSPEVNCRELAANTTRFSGAEIAGVVRAATSYALERKYSEESQSLMVTREDFERALQSISPAYTHSESHILSQYLPRTFLSLGPDHDTVITSLLDLIHSMKTTLGSSRLQTALIYGTKGTGKTTLAARVAVLGHFTYVKIVTASNLIGLTDFGKVDFIHQVFKDAFSSKHSLIILDDLHRLVEYVPVGDRVSVSHSMMHVLSTLLSSSVPSTSSVLVLGTLTVTQRDTLHQSINLNLPILFTWHHYVPVMNSTDILSFLKMSHIYRLNGGQFSIPSHLRLPVSQLLNAIQCACIRHKDYAVTSCFSDSTLSQNILLDCLMNTDTKDHNRV